MCDFNGIKSGNESDVDCGGNACPKCLINFACNSEKDCVNGRCDPISKICDNTIALNFINTFIILMSGTVVVVVMCAMSAYSSRRNRIMASIQRRNLKNYGIVECNPETEQRIEKEKHEEDLRRQAQLVFRKSRLLMVSKTLTITNVFIQKNKHIRDRCIWAYRLLAIGFVEATHTKDASTNKNHDELMRLSVSLLNISNELNFALRLMFDGSEKCLQVLANVENEITRNAWLIPKFTCGSAEVNLTQVIVKDSYKATSGLNNIVWFYTLEKNAKWPAVQQQSYPQLVKNGETDPNWGYEGPRFAECSASARGLLPRFSDKQEAREIAAAGGLRVSNSCMKSLYPATFLRKFVGYFTHSQHWKFYVVIFVLYVAIFCSFALKGDRSNKGLATNGVTSVNANGILLNQEICGFGSTCLPVPPQYNLDQDPVQEVVIPLIYAFMHCALFTLGLLPIPFLRGFWRDVVNIFPQIRFYIPVDNFEQFHIRLGYLLLFFLSCGAVTWMSAMASRCLRGSNAVEQQACLAFDPGNLVEVLSPVANVTMLRVYVWSTWFYIIPLMRVSGSPPQMKFLDRFQSQFFLLRILRWIRQNWYEVCYYSHWITAYFTVILALVARFDVFYPVMISWGFYFIDLFREKMFHEIRLEYCSYDSICHSNSVNGQPTALQLRFRRPNHQLQTAIRVVENQPANVTGGLGDKKQQRKSSGGKTISLLSSFNKDSSSQKKLPIRAGQWIYLQVSAIDSTWHPFSITNKSRDDFLELQVGIKGKWKKNDELGWYLPKQSETWTYKMWRLMTEIGPDGMKFTTLPVKVRGPYGSAFVSCFDSSYAGTVVIGAGTGLTAAESVMREFVQMRHEKRPVPNLYFFVWSCNLVDDLLWVFPTLKDLIVQCVREDTLKYSSHRPDANMWDWLSITIYCTKASAESKQMFMKIIDEEIALAQTKEEKSILRWLCNQILFNATMDDPNTHIVRLLFGAREKLSDINANEKLSICYCGPTSLANLIYGCINDLEAGVEGVKTTVEFTADSQ